MITKERLEELIGENIYIYEIENGSSKIKVCNLSELNHNNININAWLKCSKLFETKEDAEFALRYKRIPKTEYLDLPTWEEFKKDRYVNFFCKDNEYMLQYLNLSNKISVFERNNKGDYFEKKATKENYLEACEICRKLWLGEE